MDAEAIASGASNFLRANVFNLLRMLKSQTCPECHSSMEEGVTLDLESRRTQTWLQGPVEEKRLTGIKTRGKELLRVVSYRCPKCGYLKSFAPPV